MEQPSGSSADHLWNDVSHRLQEQLSDTTYATWFGSAVPGALRDDEFVVVLPNEFTRGWIEGHFLPLLRGAVCGALGRDVRVRLDVVEEEEHPVAATADREAPRARVAGEAQPGSNPKYTFDNFVIGSSNRFAHAAALAVAESPAQAYNPLFVYGDTGLGKTHLLQAIGAYVSDHSKGMTTRYVTSETFTNDFINSLRDKRIEGFKHRYRAYDVLLVDDIQFLEGKERFQEEFFHTFNSLYEAGRQIVISSDRPPKEIATLEERLRSRFEWGLITDIQPPDLETRIAILRKKVTTDRIAITRPRGADVHRESRVDEHPRARGCAHAGRRLLVAHRSRARPRARRAGAPRSLPGRRRRAGARPSRRSRRSSASASRSRSRSSAASGARRPSRIRARSRCTSRASSRTPRCPKIGKEFGGRDHTTVLHANAKITRMISEDRSVYNLVQDLTARIKHRG